MSKMPTASSIAEAQKPASIEVEMSSATESQHSLSSPRSEEERADAIKRRKVLCRTALRRGSLHAVLSPEDPELCAHERRVTKHLLKEIRQCDNAADSVFERVCDR